MTGSHAKMATLLPDEKAGALKTVQVHSFALRDNFDFPEKLYDTFLKIALPKTADLKSDVKSDIAAFETELGKLDGKQVDLKKIKIILKEKASNLLIPKKNTSIEVFSLFLKHDFITPEKCYDFLKAYDPDFPQLHFANQKDDIEREEKTYRKNIVNLIKQAAQKSRTLAMSFWSSFKNDSPKMFDSPQISEKDEAYFAALFPQSGQQPPAKRAQSTLLSFSPVV